jgi:hypothetical protein
MFGAGDRVCTAKTSSVKLSEAINLMPYWYCTDIESVIQKKFQTEAQGRDLLISRGLYLEQMAAEKQP